MALNVQPNPLQAGTTCTITITGSSHAGEIVQVNVTNGEGQNAKPEITLDVDGNGSTTWTVPDWTQAYFNYSSCAEIYRAIDVDSQVPTP